MLLVVPIPAKCKWTNVFVMGAMQQLNMGACLSYLLLCPHSTAANANPCAASAIVHAPKTHAPTACRSRCLHVWLLLLALHGCCCLHAWLLLLTAVKLQAIRVYAELCKNKHKPQHTPSSAARYTAAVSLTCAMNVMHSENSFESWLGFS